MTSRLAPPGKLANPSSVTLPGPGPLFPPAMNIGETSAALPEDMAAWTARAASLAKATSDKATELAAQHGPTAVAAAKRAALGAADAAKAAQAKFADPQFQRQKAEQLRRNWAFAAGAVVILGAGGWFYAKHQATLIATSKIMSFLQSDGLAAEITYQSVSASPFGAAQLHGVAIADGNGITINIRTIGISGITRNGDQVTGGTITASGFDIPALQIMRAEAESQDVSPLLGTFPLLGYTDLTGNATFSVHPGSAEGYYRIESSGNIDNAGRWRVSTDLGNVPPDLSATISALSAASGEGGMVGALSAFQSLANVSVIGLKLTVDDAPFHTRIASLKIQATPGDNCDFLFLPVNVNIMAQDGMSLDAANQIVKTFYGWQNNGGTLTVNTNLAQPLPLINMDGDNPDAGMMIPGSMPQPAFSSLADFFAKTNAQVSS